MIGRYHEGRVPEPGQPGEQEAALQAYSLEAVHAALAHVDELVLNRAVACVMDAVGEVNRYLEQTAPWARSQKGKRIKGGDSALSLSRRRIVTTALRAAPSRPARAHGRAVAPPGMRAARAPWGRAVLG